MSEHDWSEAGASVLGMQLNGAGDEVLVWFNRLTDEVRAQVPEGAWEVGMVSNPEAEIAVADGALMLPPRSVVALVRGQIPAEPPPAEMPPPPSEVPGEVPPGIPPERPDEVPVEDPEEVPGREPPEVPPEPRQG